MRCREPYVESVSDLVERDFFIDNLLVRIHFIIVMIRWTGLAPWENSLFQDLVEALVYFVSVRGRVNMARSRQSRPDYGLGFHGKVVKTFQGVSSSLGSGSTPLKIQILCYVLSSKVVSGPNLMLEL